MIVPEQNVICEIESNLRNAIDLLDQSQYCSASCLVGQCLQLLNQIEKQCNCDFCENE